MDPTPLPASAPRYPRLLICKTLYFIEFGEVSLGSSAEISLISKNEEFIDISIIFFFFFQFVYSFGLVFLAENLVLLSARIGNVCCHLLRRLPLPAQGPLGRRNDDEDADVKN